MIGQIQNDITRIFNLDKNTRSDFRSQGRGQRGGRGYYRGRGYRGNRGGRNRDSRATDTHYSGNSHNLFSVGPWPPVESVPTASSNTVVPDLTQRQIGGQTPQLVRTPDSWKSNKTPTPKQQSKQPTPTQSTTGQPQPTNQQQQQQITVHSQSQVYQPSTQPSTSTSQSSETTSSNIIPIPTPRVHQVQQEQGHLHLPPVAISPPPINPANIELPLVVDTLPNNTTQPINNILIHQQQPQNQQQLVNQQQQLFNLQSQQFTNQQYRFPDPPDFWSSIATQPLSLDLRAQQVDQKLQDQRIFQENRARNEYRNHMQQRTQNKAQKYLMDGMLMNLEVMIKNFDIPSHHPFGNCQANFNLNQYIDNLSQIPSQDQQGYSNDFDQYQMQRDDDHDSNDDVFGEADIIELQVRGRRGRGMKNRGRGKAQSQSQPLSSSHQLIQGSTQSKLKVPGQRHGKTIAANGTINRCAQSSRIKQIAGGSDFNFGSNMDIDTEQMMEMDLTQTQSTTNDGPIISTTPPQFGTPSWHIGGKNVNIFAAQRAIIQYLNYGNGINIPQQAYLAAQGADGLGFQRLIGREQEQSEDGPEQDQGQLDLNNLSDNPGNEGPPGLTQETRRSEANKSSTKSRSKSSRKKKKGH
ncbi:MAG: hypothetical protein EZS28_017538 [Streblomastix strix]|uniref:Uncharacterized protein n=1 Tax=Streblomastix strix TaxID=222440 RepID=A0A5J4VWL6_9EUKA|nr:MAG: hypothetical protein EZS28_017538 [Streblomastix strix]